MIEMRKDRLEIKGSKMQLITEFASIARHLVRDFDFDERDFEFVHDIAFLSDEQLAEKAKDGLKDMVGNLNEMFNLDEMVIKRFKEFMETEDCDNCPSSGKCLLKNLYDDVVAGKANGSDILKATMSVHKETDTHKDIHKDKPNDLFGNMFNDLL